RTERPFRKDVEVELVRRILRSIDEGIRPAKHRFLRAWRRRQGESRKLSREKAHFGSGNLKGDKSIGPRMVPDDLPLDPFAHCASDVRFVMLEQHVVPNVTRGFAKQIMPTSC